jgi:hypothetical protein
MKRLTKIKPIDVPKSAQLLGSKNHKFRILQQGSTNFQNIWEPSPNFRRQMSGTKGFPYYGPRILELSVNLSLLSGTLCSVRVKWWRKNWNDYVLNTRRHCEKQSSWRPGSWDLLSPGLQSSLTPITHPPEAFVTCWRFHEAACINRQSITVCGSGQRLASVLSSFAKNMNSITKCLHKLSELAYSTYTS